MIVSGIQKAIDAAGSQSALARLVGVTPQAIQKWAAAGEIPAKRVTAVEAATGVPRHELLPELFAAPQPAEAGNV